jgi:hypothetical protein
MIDTITTTSGSIPAFAAQGRFTPNPGTIFALHHGVVVQIRRYSVSYTTWSTRARLPLHGLVRVKRFFFKETHQTGSWGNPCIVCPVLYHCLPSIFCACRNRSDLAMDFEVACTFCSTRGGTPLAIQRVIDNMTTLFVGASVMAAQSCFIIDPRIICTCGTDYLIFI